MLFEIPTPCVRLNSDSEKPEQPEQSEQTDLQPANADPIRLDQFLKLVGVADTGGMAKLLIQDGQILLNGEIETRRRKQLELSDTVEFGGQVFCVRDFVDS